MSEEQHVTEFDGSAAIILRQRVLIELGESRSQTLLHLRGERDTTVLPVNGDELGKFVGTLEDPCERVGHKAAVRGVTSHLAHQQQRRVTHLHLFARLGGERRDLLGPDLGHELSDASGDLDSVLVELALPEQASEDRAAQLQLRRNIAGRRAFVRARTELQVAPFGGLLVELSAISVQLSARSFCSLVLQFRFWHKPS